MDIKTSDLLGNYIPFKINGDEKMRVDGSGNVGIGTLTPSNKLHINGTLQVDAGDIKLAWGATGINRKLAIENSDTYRNGLVFKESRELQLFSCGASGDGGKITFFTRAATAANSSDYGTERMRITESGNVGIGTSSPSVTLDVNGTVKTKNPCLLVAGNQNTNVTSNSGEKLKFNSILIDTHNGFNTSQYVYTVPRSGYYLIGANIYLNSAGRVSLVAGSNPGTVFVNGSASTQYAPSIIYSLSQGDAVYLESSTAGLLYYMSATNPHTYMYIYMIG